MANFEELSKSVISGNLAKVKKQMQALVDGKCLALRDHQPGVDCRHDCSGCPV